jgi:zinc transport system ATP-binding protein
MAKAVSEIYEKRRHEEHREAQQGRTSAAPIVELEHVTFSYGGTPVIEDATFTVASGDFVSMIGPNGAGKTTLAKIILGLLTPTRGRISLCGGASRQQCTRVGYVPQHGNFDPEFPITAGEVVLMGRVPRGLGFYRKRDRRDAAETLKQVGLPGFENRPFSDLSGGERQRVLIARALLSNPELLILDEPTANIDSAAGQRLGDILARLKGTMTIMLITHDLGFVSELVDKVLCVNVRVRIHPTQEVTPELIQQLFGTNARMVDHDHDEEQRHA